jgi:hypothetical protein
MRQLISVLGYAFSAFRLYALIRLCLVLAVESPYSAPIISTEFARDARSRYARKQYVALEKWAQMVGSAVESKLGSRWSIGPSSRPKNFVGLWCSMEMLYASNSFVDQSLPDFAERIKLAIVKPWLEETIPTPIVSHYITWLSPDVVWCVTQCCYCVCPSSYCWLLYA